jgi:hypothetical protein
MIAMKTGAGDLATKTTPERPIAGMARRSFASTMPNNGACAYNQITGEAVGRR